eukprot:c4412_g1_i1.p1 GENE.c4412_g1_i1~~c4412_g1_i1.p1  ORF type:complete len:377 (+),score=38.34 c4412_g1_i1:251-1381(+)
MLICFSLSHRSIIFLVVQRCSLAPNRSSFEEFFKRKATWTVPIDHATLCAEMAVTNTHVIVISSLATQANTSMATTMHVVNFAAQQVDSCQLEDKVAISSFRNRVGVMLMTKQKLIIHEVTSHGCLVMIQSISLDGVDPIPRCARPQQFASFITGLRHRVMVSLLRQGSDSVSNQFFAKFDAFHSFTMNKFQFLDDSHVLIKLAATVPDLSDLLVVCNVESMDVISFFTTSEDLWTTLHDNFGLVSHSAYENDFSREQRVFRQQSALAKSSRPRAIRQLLSHFPLASAQTHTLSPYLDLRFFVYDDNGVMPDGRGIVSPDQPVKFFVRDTKQVAFKLSIDGTMTQNRSGLFLLHPVFPMALVTSQSSRLLSICVCV